MANKHNTHNQRLCALRVADPKAFIREVTRAIEKSHANVAQAAITLEVERRTLFMWIKSYSALKKATSAARKAA